MFHEDVIPTDFAVDDHIALAIETSDDRQIGLCETPPSCKIELKKKNPNIVLGAGLIDSSREETDQFCPVIIHSITFVL